MSNRQALIVILAAAALQNANAFVPPSLHQCSLRTASCAAKSAVEDVVLTRQAVLDRIETPEAEEAVAAVEETKLIMDIPPKPAAVAEIEEMKLIMDIPPKPAAAAEKPKPAAAEKAPKKKHPLPNFLSCSAPEEAAAAVAETKPIMDIPPRPAAAAENPKPAAAEKAPKKKHPLPNFFSCSVPEEAAAAVAETKPIMDIPPKPVAAAEKPVEETKPITDIPPRPAAAAEKPKPAAAKKAPEKKGGGGRKERVFSPWPKPATARKAPAKKGGGGHKEGVFSPVVVAAGAVLGGGQLKIVRARVISVHSDLIKSFVGTSDSAFGRAVLRQLFDLVDADNSGYLDKEELAVALDMLGFKWLDSKQIDKIFAKADTNGDKEISLEEFMEEAPKTLKMNLIKLAKANGTDMGLMV